MFFLNHGLKKRNESHNGGAPQKRGENSTSPVPVQTGETGAELEPLRRRRCRQLVMEVA